jgi:hypothetical protein
MAKWQALIPTIERILKHSGDPDPCPGQRMQVHAVDAADFARSSFALVDYCPGGAYTDWIVAMRLEGGQPVKARFRKDNRDIGLGFAQGTSVMHGRNVRLVPEKQAIYDFSWDYMGENPSLEECVVNAYIWNTKFKTFDWDAELTKPATGNYCSGMRKQLNPD